MSGTPIVGVTIYQEDKTSNGTTSDTQGIYHISVPEKASLVFSYLGYRTQTVRISNKSVINVKLEEDKLALDAVEIVSVGYGSVARRDLTGSVGKVEMDELVKTTNSNFDQAIAGKIAGDQKNSRPRHAAGGTGNPQKQADGTHLSKDGGGKGQKQGA